MKINPSRLRILVALTFISVLALSCREDFLNENSSAQQKAATRIAAAATDEHPGRLLASNCFQCHGTNGYGMEHIAGKSANELVDELREMQAKNPRLEIMNAHAKGYTPEQIQLIADFFSKQ